MQPLEIFLDIFLIVLCITGVWALVEIALFTRKTSGTMDELVHNVNNTLAEVEPVITKVDGLLDEIDPAIKKVDPLVVSAIGAVDSLSKDLDNIDVILGDVSRLTTGVADASDAATASVSGAMNAANNLVNAAIDHVRGDAPSPKKLVSRVQSARENRAEAKAERERVENVVKVTEPSDAGYFKYPTADKPADTTADKPADTTAE